MYTVSAGFKAAADDPQRIPQKRLTLPEEGTTDSGYVLGASSDSEISTLELNSGDGYVKQKEIQIFHSGDLRVKFQGYIEIGNDWWAWRISRNGISLSEGAFTSGLDPSNTALVHEYRLYLIDVQGVQAGDLIQLWMKASDSNGNGVGSGGTQLLYAKDYRLYFEGIKKALSLGGFSQRQYEGEELTASDITVECLNDAKEFNFLKTTKTNVGKIGKLELGFDGEYINRYRGYLADVDFYSDAERPKCRMRFTSKAQRAIERSLGSEAFPLDYSASAYNPADLSWDLLTVRAGLDATASTANVDIDYTSWLAYKSICSDLTFSLKAYFTGQSISEALRLIGQLTDAVVYGETDGKIYFRKHVPKAFSSAYLFTDANAHLQQAALGLNRARIINKAKVWHGYNPSTKAWAGSVTKENTTSQMNYSLLGREFDNTSVWHNDLNSATAFGERLVARYNEPIETVTFQTKQGTQAIIHQLGDEITLTWGQMDYAAKLMKIYGIDAELSGGHYSILAEDMSALNKNYFILDSATNGVLDQNILY